jgi:CheY-specific phosphatase CheX
MGEKNMRAQLDAQCVIEANSGFWEQMLGMTLDPAPRSAEFMAAAGHLLGTVDLTGAWIGRIEVRMAEALAYEATAAMLMQPVGDVIEADALDAAKEIANMVAGGIKSSLPRPCSMTVPESAVTGRTFSSRPMAEDSLDVVFRHAAGEMLVRVCEQECCQ